jgi:putative ABC transport system substrate-binding protein
MRGLKMVALAGIVAGLGAGTARAEDVASQAGKSQKTVAITMVVEVPQLLETKKGVLLGLAERGYVEGKNLKVEYQSANGNIGTMQQIARKFVADRPDLIVPITTAGAQAIVGATDKIPVVFATVIDPVKAKVIKQYEQPGGNVTGVSDRPPIAKQLDLFKQIMPNLKKLGYLYNTSLDSSLATLQWIKDAGKERGIEIVEAAAPTTNEVIPSARSLVGKVDAIYGPNDTTVVAALEAVVKIGQDTKTPVFTGETRGVERGALASIGLNYTQVGKIAGHMAAEVLDGKNPGKIDAVLAYEVATDFPIVVNKGAAQRMGVTLPASVLSEATKVIQ